MLTSFSTTGLKNVSSLSSWGWTQSRKNGNLTGFLWGLRIDAVLQLNHGMWIQFWMHITIYCCDKARICSVVELKRKKKKEVFTSTNYIKHKLYNLERKWKAYVILILFFFIVLKAILHRVEPLLYSLKPINGQFNTFACKFNRFVTLWNWNLTWLSS